MNKTSIKVIKRKDTEAAIKIKTKNTGETTLAAGGEKIERNLQRRMVDTVSNWISERRENNRIETVSAIRKLFGDESLMSKTA